MKHVLITGGAGFIGSHLAERYIERGYLVTVIDNLITGSEKNIEHLKCNANFRFIKHDVSVSIPELEFGKVDFLLHFACPASPVDFTKIPLEIMQVDSFGTYHALMRAKQDGARFVLASTSEIYGDPLVHPQKEDYWGNVNPIGLRSCYDEAKRFSEAMTMVFHRKYNVNTGIVRIFNTYGPRMRLDDGRVVPNLCGQALQNKPLTIYGTGKQTRSFCYIDDLVEGILRLVDSRETMPVNIGNPEEYAIEDFAKIILELLPESKSTLSYLPLQFKDDPRQRRPDIGRAYEVLNKWEPKVSLKDGLKKTIEYFKKELS
jgi:dTDP-glucose 4,6-dehydratase